MPNFEQEESLQASETNEASQKEVSVFIDFQNNFSFDKARVSSSKFYIQGVTKNVYTLFGPLYLNQVIDFKL